MNGRINKLLQKHADFLESEEVLPTQLRYESYAVSNLRGGVGKSTLTFNLAYEISRHYSVLVADLCPQCNLTEIIRKGEENSITIYDSLLPKVMGPAFGDEYEDISYRISETCSAFKGGKRSYFIPGSAHLFEFPSALYQQLQAALAGNAPGIQPQRVSKLLLSLKEVLRSEAIDKACTKTIVDTSPFYTGGTHLAWCASDALIIPVRVDEHSIESLDLTLSMINNQESDFNLWNQRAGGLKSPKVAAVVMTMVGAKSQVKSRPDNASVMYIERALQIIEKFPKLFEFEDPADSIVITNDFMSAGRVSGAKGIPMSQLKTKAFHTVAGSRLQVNRSVERYQRELAYLLSVI